MLRWIRSTCVILDERWKRCDGDSDSLALGGDENDLLVDIDAGFVAEKTWNHELGTVAHCVDGAVLDHNALVRCEEGFERLNDGSEVRLVALVVVEPLRV